MQESASIYANFVIMLEKLQQTTQHTTMLVITPEGLEKRSRIEFPADKSFRSARYLTADEEMGFSYNENTVAAGTDLTVWLKHHWEANYIVSGQGEVTDLADGRAWSLRPGILYVVGPNDRHRLRFTEDECHLSIFYPPLTGNERFDEDGSYEASGPVPITDRRMFVREIDEQQSIIKQVVSTDGEVKTTRLLSDTDAIGFGLEKISISAGALADRQIGDFHQANHVIAGAGELTDFDSGATWTLRPSDAFCVRPNNRWRIRATDALDIISISARNATSGGR